jgi:uncharacterized membrane protein YeaQ/YmgE (transglycosylase-associated protein family)
MDISTIISLVSGAVGGNIAGPAMSEKNLGPIVNTIAGLIGGGAGEFILKAFGFFSSAAATATTTGVAGGGEMDWAHLLANIGVSGVSGGVLTAIIAAIKGACCKS